MLPKEVGLTPQETYPAPRRLRWRRRLDAGGSESASLPCHAAAPKAGGRLTCGLSRAEPGGKHRPGGRLWRGPAWQARVLATREPVGQWGRRRSQACRRLGFRSDAAQSKWKTDVAPGVCSEEENTVCVPRILGKQWVKGVV